MIGALLGALAGYKLGDRYLSGSAETPLWTGHLRGDLAGPAIMLTQVRHHGKTSYRVSVIADGKATIVEQCSMYEQAVACIQSWQRYLEEGGTVERWRVQTT